jgi:hypothetical protein
MKILQAVAMAAAFTGTVACSDVTYQPQTAFSANVLPLSTPPVRATVAAVSQGRRETRAGIELTGAGGTTYGWQINEGTCATPGPMLGGRGAYPDVVTNAGGGGEVNQTFIAGLMRRGDSYHAVIVDAATRANILACGNFEQLQF